MKTYIPLDRLERSRDSGSALYKMHPTDVLGRAGGDLGWGFGGVGEFGYICKLNPNRSLGRMRIFYITSCGLSAFIRCLLLVFNS